MRDLIGLLLLLAGLPLLLIGFRISDRLDRNYIIPAVYGEPRPFGTELRVDLLLVEPGPVDSAVFFERNVPNGFFRLEGARSVFVHNNLVYVAAENDNALTIFKPFSKPL